MCVQELLKACRWPVLSAPYDVALRAAVEFVLRRADVASIVVAGTIIDGNPDASSDLDLYVINRAPVRQRIQRFFHHVPTEIFLNPVEAVEAYFEEEQLRGRPSTAHMLATGKVILDRDRVLDGLLRKARSLLARGMRISKERLVMMRYHAATLYEDAVDTVERDPLTSSMIAWRAVDAMLEYSFASSSDFIPRSKEVLRMVSHRDPRLGSLVEAFLSASTAKDRLSFAGRIADQTIGVRGFFEWESEPEDRAG